jgi:hypothetical protein
MKVLTLFESKWMIVLLTLTFFLPVFGGCRGEDEVPFLEAEGYVIGHHPCVGSSTVTTSMGEGKGYLVATSGSDRDTLMLFGVPVDMFDVPVEWYSSSGYLFPEEGQGIFIMRFSYQESAEKIGLQYPCISYPPIDNLLRYAYPEYIILQAERVE